VPGFRRFQIGYPLAQVGQLIKQVSFGFGSVIHWRPPDLIVNILAK
jgi:hypothetical protein